MKVLGIIPARFASTRFPGKPLIEIHGKSMIQRVYQQSQQASSLQKLVIATDDNRIKNHVETWGGNVLMTNSSHQSGTDRCAEIINRFPEFDVAVNIQGDEPYINPEQINEVVSCFFQDKSCEIATLIKKIDTTEELCNTNRPKVVVCNKGKALYFSRLPIPLLKNIDQTEWVNKHVYYKHIGIYAYKTTVLQKLTTLPISSLEQAESLEQLRWLENRFQIYTKETQFESQSVDTPDDLKRLIKI